MAADWNVNDFLRGLDRQARPRAKAAGLRALDQFGKHVLGKAQQVTPIKSGALQNSATSEPAKSDFWGTRKTIGFNTSYAAAVHERLDLHHPQGQAKFLESVMNSEGPKLVPFVAGEMKKAL